MKKIFATLALCVMTLAASAQVDLKSIDFKGNLRGDLGLGAGVTLGLTEKIDLAPSFNYYFCDGADNIWTIEGDFHYNFNVAEDFVVYPLAGATIFHGGDLKFGVNLGAGVKYNLTDNIGIFAEAKYQYIFDAHGADDTYVSLGVNINI